MVKVTLKGKKHNIPWLSIHLILLKYKLHTVTMSVGVLTKFQEEFFCFTRTISRDETYNAFVRNKIIYYLGSM